MFATDDTIAAIATPLGRSGVGVVRLSGSRSSAIACALIGRSRPLRARHATLATLGASAHAVRDSVIVTHFPAPHSYTGEDVVELSAHGSPVVLRGILQAAMAGGARLAEPGEFTLRAFLNGKLDLVQAEAVADLVDAVTPLQARAAFDQLDGTLTMAIGAIESRLFDLMARLEASLDFPEEGYHFVAVIAARGEIEALRAQIDDLLRGAARGRLVREGARIAIIGTPNVGKSSLFNALVRANRAIVTPIPGTTRDLVTERADIGGISMSLIDTAGIRVSTDIVEMEGVARARQAAANADLVLIALDSSRPLEEDDRALVEWAKAHDHLVVINKIDLPDAWSGEATDCVGQRVSAETGAGLDRLIEQMIAALGKDIASRDEPLVTNVRHAALLTHARASLNRAIAAVGADAAPISEEFLLADLQDAHAQLQEITGQRTSDDLLHHIFKNFCIGK